MIRAEGACLVLIAAVPAQLAYDREQRGPHENGRVVWVVSPTVMPQFPNRVRTSGSGRLNFTQTTREARVLERE